MDWHTRQEPIFPGCRDGRRIGARAVRADPVRGEQRLLLQRLAEEELGGLQIALRGEQEVHGRAVLVDGAVEIAPLAPDLDVDPMGTGHRLGRLRATISGSATMTQHTHLTASNGLDYDRTLILAVEISNRSWVVAA